MLFMYCMYRYEFTVNFRDCLFHLHELWRETETPWEDIAEMYLKAVDLKIADLYLHLEDIGLLDQNSPGLMVSDKVCLSYLALRV